MPLAKETIKIMDVNLVLSSVYGIDADSDDDAHNDTVTKHHSDIPDILPEYLSSSNTYYLYLSYIII